MTDRVCLNRLRRMAVRQGYRLRKWYRRDEFGLIDVEWRRRDPKNPREHIAFGYPWFIDPKTGERAPDRNGAFWNHPMATARQIEEYLTGRLRTELEMWWEDGKGRRTREAPGSRDPGPAETRPSARTWEQRLRRLAARQGLRLTKTRRRAPRAGDFSRYGLRDGTGAEAFGFEHGRHAAALDQIEAHLTGLGARRLDGNP